MVEVFDLISSDEEEQVQARTIAVPRSSGSVRTGPGSNSKNEKNDDNPAKLKKARGGEIDKNDYYAVKREFEPVGFGKANLGDEVIEVNSKGEENEDKKIDSNSNSGKNNGEKQ